MKSKDDKNEDGSDQERKFIHEYVNRKIFLNRDLLMDRSLQLSASHAIHAFKL